jgi:hypothetical protein
MDSERLGLVGLLFPKLTCGFVGARPIVAGVEDAEEVAEESGSWLFAGSSESFSRRGPCEMDSWCHGHGTDPLATWRAPLETLMRTFTLPDRLKSTAFSGHRHEVSQLR